MYVLFIFNIPIMAPLSKGSSVKRKRHSEGIVSPPPVIARHFIFVIARLCRSNPDHKTYFFPLSYIISAPHYGSL